MNGPFNNISLSGSRNKSLILFVVSLNCHDDIGSHTDDVVTSTSRKENGGGNDKKDKRKNGKESKRMYLVHINKVVNLILIKGRRH